MALALGFYHIGSRSLWGDEAFSVTLAQQPLGEFWRVVSGSQANMSLYYVLLKGWVVFGEGEAVVRLLSLLAAVATVPVLYAVAARLFDRRVAAAAALILAVNGFFLRYAQEARGYALVMFLTALATLLFLLLEDRPPERRLTAAYIIVGALGLYAHFFAFFVLGSHLLALLLAGRPWRRQFGRLAAIGGLGVPLLFFIFFRDAGQVSHLKRPSPTFVIQTFNQLAGGRLLFTIYAAAVFLAFLSWLRASGWRRQWPMVCAATWAATPIAGSLAMSLAKPIFYPRFLIVALPAIILLVGAGISRLPRAAAMTGVAIIVVVSTVHVAGTPARPPEDFRAATRFVLANDRPGDAVAFYRPSRRIPFWYYARRLHDETLPRSLVPTSPYGQFDLIADYRHEEISPAELATIGEAVARGRIWLFLSRWESERDPQKRRNRARLLATVEKRAALRHRRFFAGLDIRLYESNKRT